MACKYTTTANKIYLKMKKKKKKWENTDLTKYQNMA